MPSTSRLTAFRPASDMSAGTGPALSRLHALYDAFARADRAAILAQLSDAVDWEHDRGDRSLPLREHYAGRDEVARLLSDPQRFPFRETDLLHHVQRGDQVAVLVDAAPLVTAAEGTTPWIEVHLWTFGPDGLVTRFQQVAGMAHPGRPTRH